MGRGAGRGGGARSPPATRAALRPARGVRAGPMFAELRTKLSPPRGRARAVHAGFGERRDVDGERGWTRTGGYRGLGPWGPKGTRVGPGGLRAAAAGGMGSASWANGVPGVFVLLWGPGEVARPRALGINAPLAWGR